MQRITFRWFHFLVVDAKAAEDYLNQMAARSWVFRGSFLGVARFSLEEGPAPRYWVEPFPYKGGLDGEAYEREQEAYLALCADAGWDLVQEKGSLRVFCTQPGRDPAPLQTDPRLDFERNWTKVLRNQQWSALFLGVYWLFYFLVLRQGLSLLWQAFLSPVLLVCGLLLTLILLGYLAYGFYLGHRRRNCRRALDRGKDLPRPGVRGAWLRGLGPLVDSAAFLLLVLLLLLSPTRPYEVLDQAQRAYLDSLPVVQAEDLGDTLVTGLLRENASLWVSQVSVTLIGSGHSIITDRYEVAAPLAGLVAQGLVDQEGLPSSKSGHFHPSLTPVPAELGFDAAWVGVGDGFQVLIFRSGGIVACVEGPMDLSDPATLDLIRTRLKVPADP